jgi:hypothetical protein
MKRNALLALLVWAFASGAQAQSIEDRLRAQLVSVTAQLRDLQAQQAAQPASAGDTGQLKAKLAAAEAEMRTLKRRPAVGATKADTPLLQVQIASLTQAKTAAETALAAKDEALSKANAALAQAETENRQLKTAEAADARNLALYRAKNEQALQVARYLLKAYRNVSVADILARKEPVTGIARARIEQAEQDYADQIYQNRIDATPPVPPRTAPAASPSSKP